MTKLIALFILIFTLIEPAISDQFDKETVMAETIGKWNITEYFGNKWEGQAVHINLDDKTSAMIKGEEDNLCVMDNKGRRSPAQVIKKEKTQLWYRAELNQYEQKTYSLQYGKAESESPLELYFDGNVAEVANHKFGVRFSWCSETSEIYDKPKPLSDLSGPIQEIRGIDGLWFGNGYWRSDRLCSEFKCEVIEHGQVLIILRQTYVLSSGGEVVLEYRIDAATPAVQVRQISTSPEFGDSFVWEFYDNYDPAHAFWRPHSTETWKGSKSKWNRQIYKLLWKDSPDSISLTAFYNWGLNGAMFWSCWSENSNRNDMLVMGAIRPSMTKLTRGYKPFIVSAWNENGNKHLSLSCRIQEGQKAFFIGVINRNSALPEGDNPESRIEGFYRQMQCLGLDEYHQMCFEWEGMADTKFPHLMTKPDNLDELRNNFNGWTWLKERFDAHVNDRLFNTHDQHDMRIRDDARTFGSDWSGAYLATGDEEYALKAKEMIQKRLDKWVREFSALGPTVDPLIGISLARLWRSTCIAFDMVADSKAFTPEERIVFLRKFTFIAEVASTYDAWPQTETGLGRGNPNFHPDYFCAKGISAALLNGHPRQREWMQYSIDEAVKFLRSYHFPSGCSDETATYQMCGLGYMLLLATALKNAGGDDLFELEPMMKRSFDYLAETQTPKDPRTEFCMLPTLGHVTSYGWSQSLQVYFAWAAKATAETDPEFSKRMMSAWERAGSMPISLHDFSYDSIWWQPFCLIDRYLPSEESPTHHQSKMHEGLGAIFRAVHDNDKEGYLLVKMGESRGHYDPDEGSLIWYAYGVPILADFGCQYNPNIECAWLHNRVSFDHWNEAWGSYFNITESHLGENVDYICGEMVVKNLCTQGEWPIRRTDFDFRLLPGPRNIDPIKWRRHVLYVHDCEAIVINDEFDGSQPTDWNLQVFAEEVKVSGNSAHFKGQFGIDLQVCISQPMKPDISISSFEHLGFNEPRLPFYWWKAVQWTAPEGAIFGPMGERALSLRVKDTSSQGYLALLIAKKPDQHVNISPLSDGFEWSDSDNKWRITVSEKDGWNVSLNGAKQNWRK